MPRGRPPHPLPAPLAAVGSPPVPRRASSNAEQGNQNGCQPSDWPVVRVGHPIRWPLSDGSSTASRRRNPPRRNRNIGDAHAQADAVRNVGRRDVIRSRDERSDVQLAAPSGHFHVPLLHSAGLFIHWRLNYCQRPKSGAPPGGRSRWPSGGFSSRPPAGGA